MRYLVLISVLLAACGSDNESTTRKWSNTRDFGVAFCTPLCEWAEQCGQADGDVSDCIQGCIDGTVCGNEPNRSNGCNEPPIGGDDELDHCLEVVNAMNELGICPEDIPVECSGLVTPAW